MYIGVFYFCDVGQGLGGEDLKYRLSQKKSSVAEYFKNDDTQHVIFLDMIKSTSIWLCVKFQHQLLYGCV